MNIITSQISDWIEDEDLTGNALSYVRKLYHDVYLMCSTSGGNKLWVDLLNDENCVAEFLNAIVKTNNYDPNEFPFIYCYIRHLMKLTDEVVFPKRESIVGWLDEKKNMYPLPPLLNPSIINDIPSFFLEMNTMLSEVKKLGHEKGDGPATTLNKQGLVEMLVCTEGLKMKMNKENKHSECLFLTIVLNHLSQSFEESSQDGARDSVSPLIFQFQKYWEGYLEHQQAGAMQSDAFLLQILFDVGNFEVRKVEEFMEVIQGYRMHLDSNINLLLNKCATTSPIDWDQLGELLEHLKQGDITVLTEEEIDIPYLKDLTQSQPCSIQAEEETNSVDKNSEIASLLKMFELQEYYPAKISLGDVMSVGKQYDLQENSKADVPWIVLQKLIMLDHRARDTEVTVSETSSENEPATNPEDFDFDELFCGCESQSENINALDLFQVVFLCCDLMLRQTLVQKMFQCRLALPFIFPQASSEDLCLCLWALRSIAFECRGEENEAIESSLVSQPMNVVSFVRLGRPKFSKSRFINNILSDQAHNTFFNIDCVSGNTEKSVANGLVEASFFFPSGKGDTFKDVTMFLNLRGDAVKYGKQVQILNEISNTVVAIVDDSDLSDTYVVETMQALHNSTSKLVLLVVDKDVASLRQEKFKETWMKYVGKIGKEAMARAKSVFAFKNKKEKNTIELKSELREVIVSCLEHEHKKTIKDATQLMKQSMKVDEDDQHCKRGKELADHVLDTIMGKSPNMIKKQMLPLQGEHWQEWSGLLKAQNRSRGTQESTSIQEKGKIQEDMTRLRREQLEICSDLSPLIQTFISSLTELSGTPSIGFFLQWLKFDFDNKSRKTLSGLRKEYHSEWMMYEKAKNKPKRNKVHLEKMRQDLDVAERKLAGASLGLEHLFREVGQVYEAAMESNLALKPETRDSLEKLPEIAAKLLLEGQSFELMDGDASCVPLTWVTAVIKRLEKLVGNKRVFTLSVLGIQSSGKSTLLNTMFGVEFPVSAGRCTRGVYMQLVKVTEGSDLPFDYVVILDTEGLRAPELKDSKYDHDNELATFVTGLGDVTLMNIKGENVSEIRDVLQIVVHAFLRMMMVNKNIQKHRTCVFIHQNVPAVNAKEKMMYGCQKLRENLDEITQEAASLEHIPGIQAFNEVIEFDSERHVWYFSDLWNGDPPMAPANPGYHSKVLEVKEFIFHQLAHNRDFFLTLADLGLSIKDMWNGVLADDFVFSFRNSLAAKAYNRMESKFSELKWNLEYNLLEWLNKDVHIAVERCSTEAELDEEKKRLMKKLPQMVQTTLKTVETELESYFKKDDYKDVIIQWKTGKMKSLRHTAEELSVDLKREITEKIELRKIELRQEGTNEYQQEIFRKAIAFADELKGKIKDDKIIQTKFLEMWTNCINQFACQKDLDKLDIDALVEQSLWETFPNIKLTLDKEMEINPLHIPLQFGNARLEGSISPEDITREYVGLRKDTKPRNIFGAVKEAVKQALPWGKRSEHEELMRRTQKGVTQEVDSILRKVDLFLNDLPRREQKFQVHHSKQALKIITDSVEQHRVDENVNKFEILDTLVAKIAVQVCRYDIPLFHEMQREYEAKNSVAAKLDAYKATTSHLFMNKVKQSSEEVIFADMLTDKVEQHMIKAVTQQMPIKLVNDLVLHFGTKHKLIKAILEDLAVNDNFKGTVTYIKDSKTFAQSWLTRFADRYIFGRTKGRQTTYQKHAERLVKTMVKGMENNARKATDEMLEPGHQSVQKWLTIFCNDMDVAISKTDEKSLQEHNVTDFANLQRLLYERLPEMERRVLTCFETKKEEPIKWPGKSPDVLAFEKLWGCDVHCPFCKEPCQRSDAKHLSENDSHQCLQHRPKGLSGCAWSKTTKRLADTLVITNCSYSLYAKHGFSCRCKPECKKPKPEEHETEDSDPEDPEPEDPEPEEPEPEEPEDEVVFHPYREYKTYYPNWDIAPSPDMASSHYWMWFMTTYKCQLMEYYDAKSPDIPDSWTEISKERAIQSLYEHE